MKLSAELEAARVEAGIETDALCMGSAIVLPVLRALSPRIKEWGRDAIPWGLSWAVGWIVDGVVDRILDGLDNWQEETCAT